MNNDQKIRVRIAPSPTGNLHIGTARAALFNWLFARTIGGVFILRIEDTDLERSEKKFEQNIFDGLKWLGLNWDEGPEIGGPAKNYRQSERLDIYEKYLKQLIDKGLAYYCLCSKEELESVRAIAQKSGLAPKYSGKCRLQRHTNGPVIRFIIPEEKISFTDIIRGEIVFDGALIGDIAIAKDLRTPLYNFAVVVDDYEMNITHIIRGEDHIANTPKQIFIQIALGLPSPKYAHLPLVLDQNRAKLSKRFSATSVEEYRALGFLPEALFNFLALLGWHPEDNREIMTPEDIIKKFSLERIQKSGAVFDIDKLHWMNAAYTRTLSDAELLNRLKTFSPELKEKLEKIPTPTAEKMILSVKNRVETLNDFTTHLAPYFGVGEYDAKLLIWKKSDAKTTLDNLIKIKDIISRLPTEAFESSKAEETLMAFANAVGKGETLWPLRVAISGLEASPGPFEILSILGKAESLSRIHNAVQKLEKNI